VIHIDRAPVELDLAMRRHEAGPTVYIGQSARTNAEGIEQTRVLIAASAPRTASIPAGLGFEPVVVDIGEFEKLEGCITCLSVLVSPPVPCSGGRAAR
jgi:N-dimethylarginine dimethylaminohydrolase